ncbi:MAG: SH3 domain-containing protein [Proteobacteria bacterium]|nr:SH3 domain-containing protein [Pseudomonadota bacterium]
MACSRRNRNEKGQSMKTQTITRHTFAALLLLGPVVRAETVYVQAVKTQLRAEPKISAPFLAEPARGAELTVNKKEGPWLEVRYSGKTGWVNRLFTGPMKPVGESELGKLSEDENLAKSARRRSSSYSVAATTRGLTAGNRVREGRDPYASDLEAVQKLDAYRIDPKELEEFKKAGGLEP